jgi:hypothetical protein
VISSDRLQYSFMLNIQSSLIPAYVILTHKENLTSYSILIVTVDILIAILKHNNKKETVRNEMWFQKLNCKFRISEKSEKKNQIK